MNFHPLFWNYIAEQKKEGEELTAFFMPVAKKEVEE